MANTIQSCDALASDRLLGVIGNLHGVLDELGSVPLSCTDVDELAGAIVEMQRVRARTEAMEAKLLAAADAQAMAQRLGHARLDRFLLGTTNAAGFDSRKRIRLATWLQDFEAFERAYQAGELTTEHLELLRRGLDNGRTHRHLRRDQWIFIDAGRDGSFKDFEKICAYWKLAADPDGEEPRDQIAETRFTAKRRPDGSVKVDGLLDPLSGAAFLSAWQAEVEKLAVADGETGVGRSHARRGADAALRLIARGAARTDGSHPDPLIHIVMSLDVARATLSRFAYGADVPVEVDAHDIDKRCELIDGTPIHPYLAFQVLGVAALERVVMTAKSRPLDVSYRARGFPKWIKHLLAVRSRGRCEGDDCDAPFAWLQADHRHPHRRGGPTAWWNAQLLCRPDNRAKGDR